MKIQKQLMLAAAVASFASATFAAPVVEVEPNNTRPTAQNIDAFFSLEADPDIASATTIPHATVVGGPGDGSQDYFSFTVGTAGSLGIFDIDYAMNADGSDFDSVIHLFNSLGVQLGANDDSAEANGAGGTTFSTDSYLEYTFADPGTYTLLVRTFGNSGQAGGNGYELQVSIENHAVTAAVPEPGTWALMMIGFGAVGYSLRRRLDRRPAEAA